eukprot:gene19496-6705_t
MAALHQELQAALDAYRAERGFKPEAWIEEKCQMLNEYMNRCGLKACICSISGGVDS